MASTIPPQILQLPVHSSQFRYIVAGYSSCQWRLKVSKSNSLLLFRKEDFHKNYDPLRLGCVKVKCFAKSLVKDDDLGGDVTVGHRESGELASSNVSTGSNKITASSGDSLSLGIREPVYEVLFFYHLIFEFILTWFPKLVSSSKVKCTELDNKLKVTEKIYVFILTFSII